MADDVVPAMHQELLILRCIRILALQTHTINQVEQQKRYQRKGNDGQVGIEIP